jgi:NTP pyrophosphatase (non-canonical NTP hydrolase)
MKDIQEKVNELTEKYNLGGSAEIKYIDLTSEVGELGKEILNGSDYGTKDFTATDNLESELGDTFFSLICVANELGIDLNTALNKVLEKYEYRFNTSGNIGSGE